MMEVSVQCPLEDRTRSTICHRYSISGYILKGFPPYIATRGRWVPTSCLLTHSCLLTQFTIDRKCNQHRKNNENKIHINCEILFICIEKWNYKTFRLIELEINYEWGHPGTERQMFYVLTYTWILHLNLSVCSNQEWM